MEGQRGLHSARLRPFCHSPRGLSAACPASWTSRPHPESKPFSAPLLLLTPWSKPSPPPPTSWAPSFHLAPPLPPSILHSTARGILLQKSDHVLLWCPGPAVKKTRMSVRRGGSMTWENNFMSLGLFLCEMGITRSPLIPGAVVAQV